MILLAGRVINYEPKFGLLYGQYSAHHRLNTFYTLGNCDNTNSSKFVFWLIIITITKIQNRKIKNTSQSFFFQKNVKVQES